METTAVLHKSDPDAHIAVEDLTIIVDFPKLILRDEYDVLPPAATYR